MKKKSKKKKEAFPGRDVEIANDIEFIDKRKENEGSTSRNTSGGRRSLSSLFRRTGGSHRTRSESPEKSKSASAASDRQESEEKQDSPSLNPKVNPRRHLGRMTVREALVNNKLRGKSPHRAIVKLQKSVLDNQPRDSLSTSLPHILDQFPDPKVVKEMDHDTSKATGHTLPRSTRRSRADRRVSKNISNNSELTLGQEPSENKMLPLDKRKYLILKSTNSTGIDAPDSSNILKDYSPSRTPYASRDISPYNQSSFLDQENMRRESFGKFLQLRETKPASHSPSLSIDKGSAFSLIHEQNTSPFEIVIPERNTATTESMVRNKTISPARKPHIFQPFPKDMDNVTHATKRKNISNKKEDIPDLHEQNQGKEMSGHRRSSYISPRRFSRNSKSSENEIPLVSDDNKTLDVVTDTDKDRKTPKYHRQFSNTIEKALQMNLKEEKQSRKKLDSEISGEIFKPSECIVEKPDEIIYKKPSENLSIKHPISPDEIPKYSVKQMQEIIKMIESQKKVDTNEEGTQTDEYIEPVVRPNILPVKTVASSVDIPNIKQENMFVPINDEVEDDVFVPPDAVLLNTLKSPLEEDVVVSEAHSNKTDANKREPSAGTTPSDLTCKEDKHGSIKEEVPEKIEENEKSKSKKGKKKSEKKKKKSKTEEAKKHDKKSKSDDNKKEPDEKDEGNSDIKKVRNKQESVTEEKKSEADEAIHHEEDEPETADKHKKGDKKLSKKNKKLKKTVSMKVPKGKSKELRPLAKSGRASSLTNITTVDIEHLKSPVKITKGKKPLVAQRSKSVEDISHSDKSLHDHTTLKKAFISEKKEAKKEAKHAKDHAPKDDKPQPKLSIAAIVAIRSKIARMKKAKQQAQQQAGEGQTSEDQDHLNNQANETQEKEDENRDEPEISTTDDVINDSVFFENEINASIGKQSDTDVVQVDDNIISLDKEVKDIVYDKRIHFASFCDDTLSEEEMIKQRQRNTRLTSRRESKVRQRQKKLISCCKKAIAFLFSHIGLCSLVIGYCIAGGFIFKALEGKAELAQREKMENLRLNFTEKIFGLAFDTTMEKHSRDQFRIQVERILKNYSQTIFKHTKEAGWDGNDNYGNETAEVEQWSFPSSLLYAITVMTTIGYGHVAPKTTHGRIVTIAYAVLGIPLTLLCLTNIGDVMAHGFRLLYGKVFCGLCCVLFRPPRRKRIDPEKGLPVDDKMLVHEDEKSEEVIQVPTSVCLLLMSAYILLGTLAFCRWEGWDVITGTYFCFITLSTIGFGDVVPGMSSKNWNKNEKLVLCGLYLLFGLSLIAMCFNLVQEDVKAKAKRLGKRLGIIDK